MKKRIEKLIKEFEEKRAELQKVENIKESLVRQLIELKAKHDILEEVSKEKSPKKEK